MSSFGSAWPILRDAATAFRPPRQVSVSQGAAQNLSIRQPGGYSGQWSAAEAPYMVEPMDMLASRRHEAVCFIGPARSGKTNQFEEAGFLAQVESNYERLIEAEPERFVRVDATQSPEVVINTVEGVVDRLVSEHE